MDFVNEEERQALTLSHARKLHISKLPSEWVEEIFAQKQFYLNSIIVKNERHSKYNLCSTGSSVNDRCDVCSDSRTFSSS